MSQTNRSAPVVVRFAALGDVVLLTVLLDALAKRHGQPVNLLCSGGWTRALLAYDPAVGDIELVSSRRRPYWLTPSQRAAVAWLREHTGPVYLCDPDRYARRIVERAIPKARIIAVWDTWPGMGAHWADWWQSVGTGEALTEGAGQPRLYRDEAWLDDARRWVQQRGVARHPLLLIQPGNKKTTKLLSWRAKGHDKFWPVERWVSVIRGALAHDPSQRVIVCGAPPEAGLVNEIVNACGDDRVLGAANDLPLPRLIGLCSIAHSMISIDTGPAHIAAAMDCPLIVLFGKHGWQRWLPRAPHAAVVPLGNRETRDDGDVDTISADAVLDAWQRLPRRPLSLALAETDVAAAE
jgi:heptosyltransferase III